MSQRASSYARRPGEDYATPPWVARVIASHLKRVRAYRMTDIWEPAPGEGRLASALEDEGFDVITTTGDFLAIKEGPVVDAIVSNPPFGQQGRSELACDFIRHALSFYVRVVAMLLRIDFDSAKTRVDLFRDEPRFAGKIVLLDRIVWFEPKIASPSENHAWFIWQASPRRGEPWLRYAGKPA